MEVVNRHHTRGPFRAAIFDFDGTLSLLRCNWQDVMIPMMADILAETGATETRAQLLAHVEEFVMRLNGKQTIFQMIRLAEEVTARGGIPQEPLAYKQQYLDLLWRKVGERVDAVRTGQVPVEAATVPGSRELLESLEQAGIELYLASGTDLKFVLEELEVLGLRRFFGPHVFGPLDDDQAFSKAKVIEWIVRDRYIPGSQLVGFGDGYVEIEEVKKVGGLAIGVASNEETRKGINAWKRERLIEAGADIIVGDYKELDHIQAFLGIG